MFLRLAANWCGSFRNNSCRWLNLYYFSDFIQNLPDIDIDNFGFTIQDNGYSAVVYIILTS